MSKHLTIYFFIFYFFTTAAAQQKQDSTFSAASIEQCVQYALAHQPRINQSLLDENIANAQIRTRLSDWYPQVSFDYTLQHYYKRPVIIIGGAPVTTARKNFSNAYFSATQNIFNRDVLLASRTATDVRTQVKQYTAFTKIDIVLNVSKAFYDVLLAQQQINLVEEDIKRLDRAVKDAYNQYKAGVVDKTDYKRAQITLNNATAEKKQYEEAFNARFSALKLFMGYPQNSLFNLVYDSTQLKSEAYLDTLQQVSYTNRIEYKILQTQQSLLNSNLNYYKWSYIPSVSAFGNYNMFFANDKFGKLYSNAFQSSYIGLTFTFPIFQGGRRTWEVRGAQLQLDRLQYNLTSLRDSIQSEYTQVLAAYKSFLSDYILQQENLDLATDVYNTIYLQYKAGVKTFLEVIIAESDLRTTQVNYLNALYNVLKSKLDVEKALGTLSIK